MMQGSQISGTCQWAYLWWVLFWPSIWLLHSWHVWAVYARSWGLVWHALCLNVQFIGFVLLSDIAPCCFCSCELLQLLEECIIDDSTECTNYAVVCNVPVFKVCACHGRGSLNVDPGPIGTQHHSDFPGPLWLFSFNQDASLFKASLWEEY